MPVFNITPQNVTKVAVNSNASLLTELIFLVAFTWLVCTWQANVWCVDYQYHSVRRVAKHTCRGNAIATTRQISGKRILAGQFGSPPPEVAKVKRLWFSGFRLKFTIITVKYTGRGEADLAVRLRPATHPTRHSEIICLIINEINCFPYTSSAVTEDRFAETFERLSINSASILFYPGAQMAYNRTPLGGGVVVRTGPSQGLYIHLTTQFSNNVDIPPCLRVAFESTSRVRAVRDSKSFWMRAHCDKELNSAS